MATMQLKVQKLGDGFGVIFPPQLTEKLALAEGSLIDVEEETGTLQPASSAAAEEVRRQVEIFKQTEPLHQDTYRALAK